jgi:hypothetical protein
MDIFLAFNCDKGPNTLTAHGHVKNIRSKSSLYIGHYGQTWGGGERGGAVGRDTVLHAGRSRVRFPMVSLDFSLT